MRFSKRRPSAGFSLLAFCLILMILTGGFLLFLWASQTMEMTYQAKNENKRIAELAARNVLELAYGYIGQDRDWGKDGIMYEWDDPDATIGAKGTIVFDPEKAAELGMEGMFSVNNLGGENSIEGFNGTVVTPNAIMAVAVGDYRGEREIAYQFYLGNPLPFSLASQGALRVSGETVVGGLESLEKAQELSESAVETDDLVESGVVSNDSSSEAVTLEGAVKVVGNVEAVGEVRTDAAVEVLKGEIKKLNEAAELPDINISNYDPLGDPSNPGDDRPTLVQRTEAVVPGALENPLYGFQRFPATTSFPDGLSLDGSAVFVDGDVVLDGPLKGSGLLVATGNITMNGGADLEADVLAAVISGGDLTVNGANNPKATGQGRASKFNGLLYSQGDLTLSDTRTVGTIVSAGSATGGPGKLVIEDSTVIATPDTQEFKLVIRKFAPGGGGGIFDTLKKNTTSGDDWEFLEPNPAALLTQDDKGNPVFKWDDSHLKLRVKLPGDDSWRVFDSPASAEAAGFRSAAGNTVGIDFETLRGEWENTRVNELNAQLGQKLVEILDFDLNEFLKTSSKLKASQVYYAD